MKDSYHGDIPETPINTDLQGLNPAFSLKTGMETQEPNLPEEQR